MPLAKEQLLIPRYKVIADYPGNLNKVGDIISINEGTPGETELVCGWYNRYLANFKPLPWWSYRNSEDMPEYVRLENGFVHKVEHWICDNSAGQPLYEFYNRVGSITIGCVVGLIPSNEEEHTAYINQKQQ